MQLWEDKGNWNVLMCITYVIPTTFRIMPLIEIRNIENISTYHPPKCMTLKKNKE